MAEPKVERYYRDSDQMTSWSGGEWVSYRSWLDMWDDYCDMKMKYENLVKDISNLYKDIK